MSKAVILYENGKEELVEISDGKRQQMYRESLNAFTQGVMFGFKAEFYKAFGLYNIRQNELYKADGVESWKEFLAKLDVSERTVQRYLQIAERIREVIRKSGTTRLLPTYVTQKDFNTSFDPFFANSKQGTLRALVAASKDYDTFVEYLDGSKQVEEQHVTKLLNQRNKKSPEQKEREEREAKIAREMDAESQSFYRTEAAARGYAWDEDEGAYRNPDGTALSDKQQTEFITAVDALRVWSRAEQILAEAKDEVDRAVKSYGGTFKSYRKHATDNSFHAKASEKFANTLKLMERIDEALRAVHAGSDE